MATTENLTRHSLPKGEENLNHNGCSYPFPHHLLAIRKRHRAIVHREMIKPIQMQNGNQNTPNRSVLNSLTLIHFKSYVS